MQISSCFAVLCRAFIFCLVATCVCNPALAGSPYSVVETGPHHRRWQRSTLSTNWEGITTSRTSSYIELNHGGHYFDSQAREWRDSTPGFEVGADGSASTPKLHQTVTVKPVHDGAIMTVTTPEGDRISAQIWGVALTDERSGKSMVIGRMRATDGIISGPANNQVVFRNCFDGIEADLVYEISRSHIAQDVVVRADIDVTSYGFDPASTRLEIWSEFLDSPQPQKSARILSQETDQAKRAELKLPDHVDETLAFGNLFLAPGRSFETGEKKEDATPAHRGGIPVGKNWIEIDGGRRFLIESMKFQDVAPSLRKLPKGRQAQAGPRGDREELLAGLKKPAARDTAAVRAENMPSLARISVPNDRGLASWSVTPGVVLDYVIVLGINNFTFRSDTTYYVTNSVSLGGTITMEGGTVIKYAPGGSLWFYSSTPVVCRTSSSRPAVLTARDDDSVGETIAGSTGTPSGYYGNPAIWLFYSGDSLRHLRIRYAQEALRYYYSSDNHVVAHAQVVNSGTAIFAENNVGMLNTVYLKNVLIHNVSSAFNGNNFAIYGEHVTVDQCSDLHPGSGNLFFTNSVLVAVSTMRPYSGTSNQTSSSSSAVFQTAGAGLHYLKTNAYRNAGTTNLEPKLLAEIKKLTTYAPVIISNNITANTTWSPQVQRDSDLPDLGYHYDPLDYVVNGASLSNATLTIGAGTVVGVNCASNNYGLMLLDAAVLVTAGSPTNLVRFIRTAVAQESPSLSLDAGGHTFGHWSATTDPQLRARFTEFPLSAGAGWHFSMDWDMGPSTYQDCQFFGGEFHGWYGGDFYLTNCLLERVSINLGYGSDPGRTVHMFNNTFYEGIISLSFPGTAWHVKDNLFVRTDISGDSSINHANNGYLNGYARLSPTQPTDVVLSSITFDSGALGERYLQSGSALINAGSRQAGAAGLYHHTTLTNQTKEAATMVDIGFHYVALNAQGMPIDTDADGTPDFQEDINGNGLVDAGETLYTIPPTVTLTAPVNGSIFDTPTNLTLSATASDSDGFITQVEFFAGSLSVGTDTNSPYSITWPNAPAGAYALTARATDNAGVVRTSSVVNVTIRNHVLFVANSTTLNAAELDVSNRLVSLGFFLTVKSASTAVTADANGKRLVVISETAPSATVSNRFTSVAVPVVTWEDGIYDDMKLTSTTASTDFGTVASQTQVIMVTTNHVMATNLSGTITVASSSTFPWGKPLGTNGIRIARLTGSDTNRVAIFGYEQGSMMVGGFPAPARRATVLVPHSSSVMLNSNGYRLFDAAIRWAVETNRPPVVNLVSPTNGSIVTAGTTVTFTAQASDNDSGVKKVTFFGNAIRIGQATAITNGQYSLTVSNFPAGTYMITAKAFDLGGLITVSTQLVQLTIRSNALFVVGNTTLNTSDAAVSNRLASLGFVVTTRSSSSVTSADADGKTLVVISATSPGDQITNKFTSSATPVVTWEDARFGDMRMTASNSGTDAGNTDAQTQLAIITPSHALAAGLTATNSIFSIPTQVAWGKPNSNAVRIATQTNDPNRVMIFGYEHGAPMFGLNAPARRVGFFLSETNAHLLTTQGWALFDAAVLWGISKPCPPTIDVMLVLDKSSSMAGQPILDAKLAASNFVTQVELDPDRIGLVTFWSTSLLNHVLSTNSATLITAINAITSSSGTRIDYGITNAQGHLVSTNHNPMAAPIMILLSDGKPSSGATSNSVVAAANAAKNAGTRIFIVAFGDVNDALLRNLATAPGDYYYAPDSSELSDVYASIAASLCRIGTQPPTVTITNPLNGAVYTAPATVLVEATAGDADGIVTNVSFYANGVFWGSDTTVPFGVTQTNVASGNYALTAVATDNSGLKATSAVVSITVNLPPTVAITAPTNNSIFVGPTNVTINATATDLDGTIVYVDFYTNSVFYQRDTNSPYSVVWTNAPVGTNSIQAVAQDNGGLSATSAVVQVRVHRAPLVNAGVDRVIHLPVNVVTLAGTASDEGIPGPLSTTWSKVSGAGTVTFGNASVTNTTATFSTYGIYTLRLTAHDTHATNSDDVVIIVNSPPSVAITNPLNGAVFSPAPATIPIGATASDLDGVVTNVSFYSGGVKIGEDTVSPYSMVWGSVPAGTYNLTARATDDRGITSTSAVVTITVSSALPPSVAITVPTNNSLFHVPTNVLINATAADPDGTVTKVEFYRGTVKLGEDLTAPYSLTWTNPSFGVYQLTARATDNSGLMATSAVVQIIVNNPPTANITAPTNGATFAAPTNVTVTATGTDLDGTVVRMEFYQGTNLIGVDTNAPYSITISNVASGIYTIFARATDNLGATGISAPVTFTVTRAGRYHYTVDADFDAGTLINLNHEVPTNNQLQLNRKVTPFPFVNIAASARGTVVKIDVNTGEIVGEYLTAPDQMGRDPSRTTVDKFGNVWVGNRGEYSDGKGSVTRIGVVIGGTRGNKNPDGSFTPNFNGEYLKPPFYYNTCVDRDGDGLIRTSRGRGNILPWSNTNSLGSNMVDSLGDRTNAAGLYISGVSTAEDEAIINYVRVAGTGTRTLAIDKNNDVWTGGDDMDHEKISGVNGLPFFGTATNFGCGGYGGLIDAHGVLWSARFGGGLLRFNPQTGSAQCLGNDTGNYGLGIDPLTGHIWHSEFGCNTWRLSTNGTPLTNFPHGFCAAQGVAVDDQTNVWVAHSLSSGTAVGHLRTDVGWVGNVELPCASGPTGVAIDSNGKVWVANISDNTAMRIDPKKGPKMLNGVPNSNGYPVGEVDLVVNLGGDASPYNYSDMTGYVILGTTARAGTWTIVQDHEIPGTIWDRVSWNATNPPGTTLTVEVRAAETIGTLPTVPFRFVTNGVSIIGAGIAGRYVEIRAILSAALGLTNSPVLYDLTITCTNQSGVSTNQPVLTVGNRDPIANLDQVTVARNSITNFINVLTNDTDPDGHSLRISAISPSQHGIVQVSADGLQLIYTPDPLFFGSDQFTYTILDGHGGLARGTVKVNVQRAVPTSVTTARDDIFVVDEDSGDNLLEVLNNDTEPYGAPLKIISNTEATNGWVSVNYPCGNRLTYRPNDNFIGVDHFTYTVSDTNGGTSTATVTVYVRNANDDPPTAISDSYAVGVNSISNVLNVLTNDYDPDRDTLMVATINATSTRGMVQIATNGTQILYTAPPNWEGNDGFYYRAKDPSGLTSFDAWVQINVTNGTNDPPIAVMDIVEVEQSSSDNWLYVSGNDRDPEGEWVEPNLIVSQPANGTAAVQCCGYVTYTPTSGFFGSNYFRYRITDSGGASATGAVMVFVRQSGNNSPWAQTDYAYVLPNSVSNVINVLTNDMDWDGDPRTLVAFLQPNHGIVVRVGTNLAYTPFANYLGADQFYYWVADNRGGLSQGVVEVAVRTNAPPLANNDTANTYQGSGQFQIAVRQNDSDPENDSLTIVATTSGTNGASVSIYDDGSWYVNYQPAPTFWGRDTFTYTIRDVMGASSTGVVSVFVNKSGNNDPTAQGDSRTVVFDSTNNIIRVLTNDYDFDGNPITLVAVGIPSHGTAVISGTNIFYAPTPGYLGPDSFTYSISDNLGGLGTATVTINVDTEAGDPPVAIISNLPTQYDYQSGGFPIYPVVREGFFTVTGTANDPDLLDPFSYFMILYSTEGVEVARSATVSNRVVSASLGAFDFTRVPNGTYDLELRVRGNSRTATATARLILETDFKLGHLRFSEQDLIIPVAGIPLTVIRTYDSMNLKPDDFGYSWSFAFNNLDVQIDDERIDTEDIDDEEFSLRVGGSWSVSLTLPNGRKTTFAFDLEPGPSDCFCLLPVWNAEPGVNATLTSLTSERLIVLPGLQPYWHSLGPYTPFEYFDFEGFKLTIEDGTEYIIKREDLGTHNLLSEEGQYSYVEAYGNAYVERVLQPSGDRIEFTAGDISHYNATNGLTRSIYFHRDGENRIDEIRDPNSGPAGLPVLRYQYDGWGNLSKVLRLVSRTTGQYITNTYLYTNANFPHYLTGIIDARGFPVARNLYDSQGRLIGVIDASGRTNRFEYDTANRRQVNYDRAGFPTIYSYDTKGKVTQIIDALGNTNAFAYDENGFLHSRTDALGNTTTLSNDAFGNVLSRTAPYPVGANPAAYTTHSTYNAAGQRTSVRLPTGAVITNEYNAAGRLTAVRDEQGNLISQTVYNELGLPKEEIGRFGSLKFGYDASGNPRHMTNILNQHVQSQYDPNGSLTNLVEGGRTVNIVLDAQGREISADFGGGMSLTYQQEAQLDWKTMSGPTVGQMDRQFDAQGRVAGLTTVNSGKIGYAYDVNGRVEYETNVIGVTTRFIFDPVGRVVVHTNLTTGASERYGYDAAGRRTSATNAFGHVTRYYYLPDGSLSAITNALQGWSFNYETAGGCCAGGGTTTTMRDALGRESIDVRSAHGLSLGMIWKQGSNVSSNYMQYLSGLTTLDQDAGDYPVLFRDEGGRQRNFSYTAVGQIERASDSGGNWYTNQYHLTDGTLTNVIGPTGEKLTYVYDSLKNLTAIRFADGNWLTNTYSPITNRLTGIRLPSGQTMSFQHDAYGRITNRNTTLGETANFGYNLANAVTVMSDGTGSTTNLYDSAGRLIGINYPNGAIVRYALNVLGQISFVTNRASGSGTAFITRYQYDATGNITNIVDPFARVTRTEYDAVGRRTKRVLPNSVTTEWLYDWRDRITNVVHKRPDQSVMSSFGYVRAIGGEPTRITREGGSYVDLQYDGAFRLTNEVFYNSGGLPQATNSYGYDAAGNRTRLNTSTNNILPGYRLGPVRSSANGITNELYGYDTGGRITNIWRDGSSRTLAYTTDDQVSATTNGGAWVTYQYDASGRRTRSTNSSGVVRRFVVATTPGSTIERPVLVSDAGGNVQQGYVYFGNDPILRFDAAGNSTYYLEDGLGSVIALADGVGTQVASFEYDAFGNIRSSSGSTTAPSGTGGDFRFHGVWLEVDSGLYHMGAREYDQRTGRFLVRDSRDGVFTRPETLHPYVYALNNPFVYTDPSGEFSVTEINVTGAIQSTMNALRQAVLNHVKNKIREQLTEALSQITMKLARQMFPAVDEIFNVLGRNPGTLLEEHIKGFLCQNVPGNILNWVAFYPGIDQQGNAHSDGVKCNPQTRAAPNNPFPVGGLSYPDFILGEASPKEISSPFYKGGDKSILIGDIKLSGNSLYNQYVVQGPNNKASQFHAMTRYCGRHTYTRVTIFLTLFSGELSKMRQVSTLLMRDSLKDGVLVFVVAAIENKNYNPPTP